MSLIAPVLPTALGSLDSGSLGDTGSSGRDTRSDAQSSQAAQRERERVRDRLKPHLASLERAFSASADDSVSERSLRVLVDPILKEIGITDPMIRAGLRLEDLSIDHTGEVARTLLFRGGVVSRQQVCPLSISIDVERGIVRVNGEEVIPTRVMSTIHQAMTDSELRRQASTLDRLIDARRSHGEVPYVGVIQPDNKILAVSFTEIPGGNHLGGYSMWIGAKEEGAGSVDVKLRRVVDLQVTRTTQGGMTLRGRLEDGSPVHVILDGRNGSVTVNGSRVESTPFPSNAGMFDMIRTDGIRSTELRAMIADARARSLPIEVAKGVNLGRRDEDSLGIGEQFEEVFALQGISVGRTPFARDGFESQRNRQRQAFESPRGIDGRTRGEDPIKISSLDLRAFQLSPSQHVVELRDALTGESFSVTYDPTSRGGRGQALDELARQTKAYLGRMRYDRIVEQIHPRLEALDAAYVTLEGTRPDSSLLSFFRDNPSATIEISYTPAGVPSYAAGPRQLVLTAQSLARIGGHNVSLRGRVHRVRVTEDLDPQGIAIEYRGGEITTVDGKPARRVVLAADGTSISTTHRMVDLDDGRKVLRRFSTVVPEVALGHEGANREVLGAPEAGGLRGILQTPIASLGKVGGITVYSDIPSFTIGTRERGAGIGLIASGISEAERLFGFLPASRIRGVVIVNSDDLGAHASTTGSSVIFVDRGRLDGMTRLGLNPTLTARHEAWHVLDDQSGWALSGGHVARVFQVLSEDHVGREFLRGIGEDQFFADINVAGHADSNERELLASVLNSLSHPTWEEEVRRRGDEFRGTYAKVLAALSQNLHELSQKGWMAASAPIIRLVNDRFQSLLKM